MYDTKAVDPYVINSKLSANQDGILIRPWKAHDLYTRLSMVASVLYGGLDKIFGTTPAVTQACVSVRFHILRYNDRLVAYAQESDASELVSA